MHQIVAIDVGHDAHAGGRQFGIEFGHLRVDAAQRFGRILILQHQHDALDRVRIRVLAEDAFALLMAQGGAAEAAHQHGRAAGLGHHDGADLLQGVYQPDAADDVALVAARDPAAAGIGIVVVDGIDHVRDAEAIMMQLLGIEIELVFGGEAAEVRIVDHTGHGLQCRDHGPALDLGQFLQVLRVGFQGVAVDFAAGTGHRIEGGRCPGRQHRLIDALGQALPGPIVLVTVAKQHRDQRQAEGARGAHQQQSRRAVDRALERHGDQLFDLLGGEPRHLRGDLRRHVAELRIGLHREGLPGVHAVCGQQRGQNEYRDPPLQAEADELINH